MICYCISLTGNDYNIDFFRNHNCLHCLLFFSTYLILKHREHFFYYNNDQYDDATIFWKREGQLLFVNE